MATKGDGFWPSRTYFFDNGLRFECQQCGQCCTGAPGSIYVGSEEIERIANHLRIKAGRFLELYTYPFKDSHSIREESDGRCLFYEQGCRIYPVRPLQCSAFPFWFVNVRNEQRWLAISRQCPGIGVGPLFDREHIIEIALKTVHI